MPAKKSARTSVKAKTSVLSSVAVQVALVAGGAAITAAAAAGLSIQLSRTQLSVALVAPTTNPIVAMAGDKDVQAFGLRFQAVKEDLYVSKVTLGVIADDDADFVKKISNDLDPAKLFAGCWLQEGTRVASDVVAGAPSMGFTLINGFSVAARQSGTLKVVCDLAKQQVAGNTPDRFAFKLAKPADIVAGVNVKGGAAVPPGNISFGSTLGGLNTKGSTASVLVKAVPGSVVTPPPTALATYCPDADADGYPLGGSGCVQAASAGAGQIAPRADGKLDCDDTNADVSPAKTEVVGNGKDDDCDANTSDQARVAATPIVTASLASGSPSGAGVPGLAELVRFNVTVDQAADVNLHGFTFRLLSTDTAGSGWNSCDQLGSTSKWGLRASSDMGTRVEDAADWSFYQADGTPCAAGKELAYASVDFTAAGDRDPKFVGAGNTNTYLLRVDTSGASAANDDIVRVDMPAVSTFQSLSSVLRSVRWSPTFPPTAAVSDVVRNLPVMGGTVVY